MAKGKSRPSRWGEAVSAAQSALSAIGEDIDALETAISDLRSVQEEYEEWKDNLPEGIQTSPMGEKLEAVTELEIEDCVDGIRETFEELKKAMEGVANAVENFQESLPEVEDKVSEADEADLPRGFGKD